MKRHRTSVQTVTKIDRTPGWLFRNLFAARVTVCDDGDICVSVDVAMRATDSHEQFAALEPALVLEDGTAVPLSGIKLQRTSGFPLRCRAEATAALIPYRDGTLPVTHVRVTYNRKVKNLPNILRQDA